jgi:predicted nicotinamide N-methyase
VTDASVFDAEAFILEQTLVAAPSIIPEITLHLATEVTPLWQMTEEKMQAKQLPPPFWAFAWPGGQGIARFILDNPEWVRGRRVVDFAAGCGLAAIAAMKAGAKSALAVDIDPLALAAIQMNAGLNKVNVEISDGLDLTRPYGKADIIVAGDICYQQAMATALTRWMRLCVEKGVDVLLADPGRAYVPEDGLTKLAAYQVPTLRDLEDREMRDVNVWRMDKI